MLIHAYIIPIHIYIHTHAHTFIYVTRYVKTCIVHTSKFPHLEIHKNYREYFTDLKISGMIKK